MAMATAPLTTPLTSSTRPPPHLVHFLADDLGWASVGYHRAAGDEDVRFNEAALDLLGAGRGVGVGSLWHLADACWLSYLDSRAAARTRRATRRRERLRKHARGGERRRRRAEREAGGTWIRRACAARACRCVCACVRVGRTIVGF